MRTTSARDRLTRWLLTGGVVGPLLFILVFLIEGATRPGYSAWLTDVSHLELSSQGWEQIANFLVCGSLIVGLAVGLRRTWHAGWVWLALTALRLLRQGRQEDVDRSAAGTAVVQAAAKPA